MGDGACTAAPSLTLRVTIGSLTLRVTNGSLTLRVTIGSLTLHVSDDVIVAVGHAMVTRYVSEEAVE